MPEWPSPPLTSQLVAAHIDSRSADTLLTVSMEFRYKLWTIAAFFLFTLTKGDYAGEDQPLAPELESYGPHRKLASRLEDRLEQRLRLGIRFGLTHTKQRPAQLARGMTEAGYLFLQLLHALDSGDMPYSNIVMEAITETDLREPDRVYLWLNKTFRFDRSSVYRAVRNYVRWFSYLPYPSFVADLMLLLARDYSLVETISPKTDLETIRWLLMSRIDIRGVDYGIIKDLWNRGARQYLNASLGNDLESESFVDYVVRIGDINLLIYLIESNVTDILNVVMSCVSQNSTVLMKTFLPMLVKHNLNPKTVDTLFQTVLQDNRFDFMVRMIENGFPVNRADYQGITLLYKAVENNNTKMVDFLLRAGANVNFTANCNVSLLHTAVERGKIEVVQRLIDLGAYIYAKDCEGNTPMHSAIKRDNEDMILELVNNKFDLNIKSDNGSTVLFYAIANGTDRVLKFLLNLGCKVNVHTKDYATPLLEALLLRKSEAVKILVNNGASLNYTTPNGNTLMHLCAIKGSVSGLNALRFLGLSVDTTNKEGETPLFKGVENNKPEVVKTLVQSGANYSVKAKNKDSLLHVAVVNHAVAALRALLKIGMKPDIEGHGLATPMERAVRMDDPDSMRTLKMYGANIRRFMSYSYKSTLLHDAARYGKDRALAWLMDNGMPSDVKERNGWTALHWAARYGHSNTVRVLLDHKATVDPKDNDGMTPLYAAARNGHAQIVQELLEKNARCNVRISNGYSPLHAASVHGHHGVVHELIERDANVNIITNSGNTALHLAAWKGHLSIIQELLQAAADPNLSTLSGYTPLHVAIIFGHLPVVQELITHKADLKVTTNNGWTPLSLAIEWKRKEIIEELKKYQ